MKKVIGISPGELVLKGKNRGKFEDALIGKIKRSLKGLNVKRVYKELSKIFVEMENEADNKAAINRISNVFGIVYIYEAIRVDREIEDIKEAIKNLLDEKNIDGEFTFKIRSKRAKKDLDYTSLELNVIFGDYVLDTFSNAKVDVHNPEIEIFVDFIINSYIYIDRIKGLGGMPMGTNGKGLILLSGGIDSPVAAFQMARRGLEINAVHFHSYPFTSERAEKKVIHLAELVSRYTGPMKLFSVNNLNIQRAISENAHEKNRTILQRRFMIRVAEAISEYHKYDALITGDNLGQVASQAIKAMKIIDNESDMLIFRPLISFDKEQIIDIAKKIETYETSIEPFDDCCTLFAPSHPNLNPTLEEILEEEEKLDVDSLVEDAIENMRGIKIE